MSMTGRITSLQNPRVKHVIRLRDSAARREEQLLVIDGRSELSRALQGSIELREVYHCEDLLASPADRALLDRLTAAASETIGVSTAVMERIAFGQRVSPFVAVARAPQRSLDDLKLPDTPLVCVLEGAEKPGNVGAVIRSADAAGASAVIVADGPGDLYNPNAIRASLGLIFVMPVVAATGQAVRLWLARRGLKAFAARVSGGIPYATARLSGPCALVLGSEAAGLTDGWSGPEIQPITLPMLGQGDSLNLSATAAILLYEALRQRGGTGGKR